MDARSRTGLDLKRVEPGRPRNADGFVVPARSEGTAMARVAVHRLTPGLALIAACVLLLGLGPSTRAVRPIGDREEREGGPRFYPGEWSFMQRSFPSGLIDPAKVEAAFSQARADRQSAALSAESGTAELAWTSAGPYNIGGRVTALAVAPGGAVIYLGSANGGVFKSTNSGTNWTPVFDAVGVPSIGALALDPSNGNTIYVGTGEANSSVDSYDGAGVFRSTNAGATWTSLGLATTRRIGAIAVDPTNSSRIYVAAMGPQFSTSPDRGFYKSEDGGAHWTKTLFVNDSTGVTDIAVNPIHPDTVFCATWERIRRTTYRRAYGPGCGIWRSIDHGDTWTRLANGLPTPTDSVGRIALAISPSRPRWVYAQIVSGAGLGYVGLGMWRTTDGGDSWVKRNNPSNTTFANGFGGFGWYFGECAVDPVDPNSVWACGQLLMHTPDGGVSFGNFTSNAHVDEHALWINPANTARIYLGSDGGFFSTTNSGAGWTHSLDLPISQFYAGAVDPNNPARLLGGTQDNDCVQTGDGSPTNWQSFNFQADGFYVLVDPTDPAVTFGEYQFGSYGAGPLRSLSYGAPNTFTSPSGINAGDRFNWSAPMCMNPVNPHTMLCGSQRVYKSTNAGTSYAPVSADLTFNLLSSLTFSTISTLDISGADTSTYYAGTDDGRVWRSINGGGAWTEISAGLPARWVTRITADPVAPATVYVTLSGFGSDEHLAHVYRSTNRGTNWSSISSNLPDVPANDIVVDPANTQKLYLATDVGVYISADGGGFWSALGNGMPVQAVMDLSLNAPFRTLVAATHGRSQWTLNVDDYLVAVPPAPSQTRAALSAPAPNPFRDHARLRLDTPGATAGSVLVFDALGRRTRTLFEGQLRAGRTELTWDGRDERGAMAADGIYFVRAMMGTYGSDMKRLVKVR